jgi:hypothetical protein
MSLEVLVLDCDMSTSSDDLFRILGFRLSFQNYYKHDTVQDPSNVKDKNTDFQNTKA